MSRRTLKDPIVSTHLLFVLNGALYWGASFYVLASLLLVCSAASFLHHLFHERNIWWRRADKFLCVVSLSCIFGHLMALAGTVEIGVCTAWLILSLGVYKASYLNYQVIHTLWHIAVFLGNVLVWYCLVF